MPFLFAHFDIETTPHLHFSMKISAVESECQKKKNGGVSLSMFKIEMICLFGFDNHSKPKNLYAKHSYGLEFIEYNY